MPRPASVIARRLLAVDSISRPCSPMRARSGGPALRALHVSRAGRACSRRSRSGCSEFKEEFYALSYRTGATKDDSWIDIDGGIGTLFAFASKGARELAEQPLVSRRRASRDCPRSGTFVGQHIYVPREGAAVHINAFNFPVWGMLEKLAPAIARRRAGDREAGDRDRRISPSSWCGASSSPVSCPRAPCSSSAAALGDLFDHLTCQDVVCFTGSAATAAKLRAHPRVIRHSVPFVAETDSLNSSILAPGCRAGQRRVRSVHPRSGARDDGEGGPEVHGHPQGARARQASSMRRVAGAQGRARARSWSATRAAPGVRHGAAGEPRAARRRACARRRARGASARSSSGAPRASRSRERTRGAARSSRPGCCLSRDPRAARAVHEVEAFGPVATVVPYRRR